MEALLGQELLAEPDLELRVAAVAEAKDVRFGPAQALEARPRLDQLPEADCPVVPVRHVPADLLLAPEREVHEDPHADRRLRALHLALQQGQVLPA